MKDYSKMSDFEINKAVAINRGGYQGHVKHMEHGVKESDRDSHGIFYFERDYCNNPSDAWPIMKESLIGVTPDEDGVTMRFYGDWTARAHCKNLQFTDKNPLRAAMIVYLMMKDEEK